MSHTSSREILQYLGEIILVFSRIDGFLSIRWYNAKPVDMRNVYPYIHLQEKKKKQTKQVPSFCEGPGTGLLHSIASLLKNTVNSTNYIIS